MKRLITILVVSVLSVISTNSSAVAGDACDACKWKVQYIQAHEGEFSCSSLQTNDIVQGQCALQTYGSDNCAQTSSWVVCNQVLDNNRDEAWCDDQDVCGGSGGTGGGGTGGGGSNTCPSDCTRPSVTYQELGNDIVKVSTRYCDESTNYVCRTKTENITPLTEKQFDTATADCVTGSCMEWGCVWTEGVGTTCGGDGNQPFCMCALYNGNYLKTVAVRLGCNSTTNTGYNCNGVAGTDDMDGSPLYCDLTASTSAGAGVCRYKKTCSTDCTNAWNLAANSKNYLYRLKGKCDYTTGSCVSNAGTVVGDFDYKCNHDNRAYETATTTTCKRMSGGKPTSCSGCKGCQTTTYWEDASNPAYQQQYHYNFSPISGTDRYQCVKTMDSLYQCNKGYYGNPGSSMTGCNACPTLASSGLTIVSQNENCSNRLVNTGLDSDDYWQLEVVGATTISQCYAMTGNQDDSTYCGATLNDGSGTFYWYDDYIKGSETVCFYQ